MTWTPVTICVHDAGLSPYFSYEYGHLDSFGAAPTAIFTALFLNRGGLLGTIAEVTGYLSGLFGAALAGYTGVLVCNSAIPIGRRRAAGYR